jgi:hypothetical protein
MKITPKFFTLIGISLLFAGNSLAADRFTLVGNCAGPEGRYVREGRNGKDIKPSLNAIASAAGKNLSLYSCFRSQARQNNILRARGCAPFGRRNCRGSVARVSYHTRTIAADIKNFEPDLKKQCQFIAKGRTVAGGVGGVGTYSGGDGHFDLGPARAWNRCAGVVASNARTSSPVTDRYQRRSPSGRQCHATRKYPSCCGPIRAARGLCRM